MSNEYNINDYYPYADIYSVRDVIMNADIGIYTLHDISDIMKSILGKSFISTSSLSDTNYCIDRLTRINNMVDIPLESYELRKLCRLIQNVSIETFDTPESEIIDNTLNIKNLILWLFPFILLVFSIGFFIKSSKKN